jgi:hypothetical protein
MTDVVAVLPLAHAGEGATWQALLALLALGLLVVVVLAALGVVTIDEPGDLILPLAGTAVLASLSGATSAVLSDWVGWAFPAGMVALVALVVASLTPLDLSPTSPLLLGTIVVAVVAGVVLHQPIVRAWHPTEVGLDNALLDDLAVEITTPEDGATVPTGTVEVGVAASGGTLGDGFVAAGEGPDDPEEQVGLTLTVVSLDTGENASTAGAPTQDCTDGCDQATYEITIDQSGEWTIFVEAKTADARAFTRTDGSSGTPTDSVTVTAE